MDPLIFNCIFLYLTVVFLSILQSRFKIITDNPWTFLFLVIFAPIIILGKVKQVKTWTELTGLEIWGWTLFISLFYPKRILPKINEGYIYAYTLFHWYLLIDTIYQNGFGFWLGIVVLISIYPTILIINAVFKSEKLSFQDKLILYYWFLFAIFFTYIDQVALDIITPILTLNEINFANSAYILVTGVQLYFIATSFSLLFIGIPVMHLEKTGGTLKQRWANAMNDWREIVDHKLENYVEYQINFIQFLIITIVSIVLFYIDFIYNFRLYLIFFYTVIFPIVFFYIKWSPKENII